MKLLKSELEKLTKDSFKIAILNLAVLTVTKCPVTEFYVEIEKLFNSIDNIRKELGLKPLTPDEIKNGRFSSMVEAANYLEKEEVRGLQEKGPFTNSDPTFKKWVNWTPVGSFYLRYAQRTQRIGGLIWHTVTSSEKMEN